jgi:hypothetical protein
LSNDILPASQARFAFIALQLRGSPLPYRVRAYSATMQAIS